MSVKTLAAKTFDLPSPRLSAPVQFSTHKISEQPMRIFFVLVALAQIATVSAIGYVAWHFISKFW